MTKYSTLIFVTGLTFILIVITSQMPIGHTPTVVGNAILAQAPAQIGATNIVTSVVLAYRGLDTLGELSILFAAASVVGLLMSGLGQQSTKTDEEDSGFITTRAVDLMFPLLLVIGFCIFTHGHLTPGGGFQGGVILAVAFFMGVLVRPKQTTLDHQLISMIESFSGVTFIVIGLWALFSQGNFLQPLLSNGEFGTLWSAGTLPLLYLAVGLKVGAELAGLLLTLSHEGSSE
jgi:multicomponent Na+:H+ antiporter subunit B